MARGVELRKDFDAATLRRLARKSKDSEQARRLLALAEIYDGVSLDETTVGRYLKASYRPICPIGAKR